MFNKLLAKVFGTSNERAVKRMLPAVEQISALEPAVKALTDDELRAKTDEFRKRVADSVAAEKIDPTDPDAADAIRAAERGRSTRFFPRHSRWCARRACARSACGISTCN